MTTRRASNRSGRRGRQREFNASSVKTKILPARNATAIRSILIYARNKVGKTRLAASACKVGRTLLIDCERGSSSIRKIYPECEVFKVSEFSDMDEIYWYLSTQDHGYEFVIIDPITRLGQLCMRHVLREKVALDLSSDPYTPSERDWGTTAELMRNVIMRFKETLDIFLIITAYERRRDSDAEESAFDYVIGPDAQPSVKGYLMGQMDIIGRLYVKQIGSEEERNRKIERRILFAPHEVYESGDRSDNLPAIMRNPTMAKIMARILEGDSSD